MSAKPPPRTSHPFFMYEHIQSQPEAFREVVERHRLLLPKLSEQVRAAAKVYLVGIGTSHHAAQIGGHLFRIFAPNCNCEIWHAFDFCLYGPQLKENDVVVVVSHRGTKQFSLRALEKAEKVGCTTAIITGKENQTPAMGLDFSFQTVGQENSSAHTVSFFGAVGVLVELVRQVSSSASLEPAVDKVVEAISTCLNHEEQMAKWAAQIQSARRIWLVGSGPTATIATEAALKIKETSYLQAEGLSVESLIHGPFQCCESEDVFVLLVFGPAAERMIGLSEMIQTIGARQFIVHDVATGFESEPTDICKLPTVPEPFEALTSLIPMQLLTYHLAIQVGKDPDGFRLEDPRFANAVSCVTM